MPLLVTNILQVLLCCAQGHALDGLQETRAELHMELKGTSHCQTATSGQLNLLKSSRWHPVFFAHLMDLGHWLPHCRCPVSACAVS